MNIKTTHLIKINLQIIENLRGLYLAQKLRKIFEILFTFKVL